ncbi:MAG: MFS transporter [Dehalococcoidia bacterium]|nr:MFS transporter [Dehalococcoidia bacterium]
MFSREFVVLWIAMLITMSGIGMVSPLLPIYVRDELGGPAVAVALSFSGVAVAQMLTSPFIGRMGDRFGLKWFIVAGFAVYSISGFGYLLADRWELVIGFRLLAGCGIAFIFPMTMAYVGLLAPRAQEGSFMGAFSVAQIAGFGIGPLLGGGVKDALGFDAAFAIMATLLASAGLVVLLFLPGKAPVARGGSDVASLPLGRLIRLAAVQATAALALVQSLSMSVSGAFLAVYIVGSDGLNFNSTTFVGILLAARSLVGALFQPLFGQLADRTDRVRLVLIGLIVAAIGQFFIPDISHAVAELPLPGGSVRLLPWLLALYVLIGTAEAMLLPAQNAIFVTIGRRVGMGSIMGMSQMVSSIGFLGGSLLGAAIVSVFGLTTVFRFAALISLAGAVLFFLLIRRVQPEAQAEGMDVTATPLPGASG